jgi:hypothetical protein
MNTNTVQTISYFALQRNHDRRTVTRRLKQHRIEPVTITSAGSYYRVTDMEGVMQDRDRAGLTEANRENHLLVLAFTYICGFLPSAVAFALEQDNLSERRVDFITLRIWAEMVDFIGDGLRDENHPIELAVAIDKIGQKYGIDASAGTDVVREATARRSEVKGELHQQTTL